MKRVELLAPCGSYESFLAAVNAGADAVYLGGRQFGARAYAENFSEEELTRAVRQAHFLGVKVYLTVNTLVKEREFPALYNYMGPLYEAGLDGVIVQDMGALCFLRQNFPGLKLHASTQMTITGSYGAAYLKALGCERIVPARELSLAEIKEIKRKVPVEIEVFIHGAMCYCYSGQCLMSSMIGGRSGNRGRCAGPCRLPYRVSGKERYYLSLKDMNTLEHIPELIEADVDAFKIEGRMKKPEYVAGAVSVYRKYIDKYYEYYDHAALQPAIRTFPIEEKDRKLLSDLYIRTETGMGYYEKRNGKDMLTLRKPGYNEADPALLAMLRERYVRELPKRRIRIFARCRAGEPLYGEVRFTDDRAKKNLSGDRNAGIEVRLSTEGGFVEKAQRRAAGEEEIREQLVKTGGTPFAVEECIVETGENTFVPVSRINALRRELLQKIYVYYGARDAERMKNTAGADDRGRDGGTRTGRETGSSVETGSAGNDARKGYTLTAVVQTKEQFEAVYSVMAQGDGRRAEKLSKRKIELLKAGDETAELMQEYLIVDADLLLEDSGIQEMISVGKIRWGIKCPAILRKSDEEYLQNLRSLIERRTPDMIYCATIDMLAWLKSISYTGKIAGEASLYAWNAEALSFWSGELDRISIPLELDSKEIRELCSAALNVDIDKLEVLVYGRTPFMVSANCIKLSTGNCDKNRKRYAELTDRLGNVFPVYTNCRHCYNILYNCRPTSYAEDMWMLMEDGIKAFRVEFTTERGEEALRVLQTFRRLPASELKREKRGKSAGAGTTKGRFRLGVE